MAFSEKQIQELKAPLDRSGVKKNPKGYDYIEGWRGIAEANRIFGFDGWDRELLSLVQVGEPYEVNGNFRVAYRATVRIVVHTEGRTITRDGTGYGSGIVKDLNDAHEGAVKEAETDAMKRALMTFGNPFGLALYDKDQSNVVDASVALMIEGLGRCESIQELTDWRAKHGDVAQAHPQADKIMGAFRQKRAGLIQRDNLRAG